MMTEQEVIEDSDDASSEWVYPGSNYSPSAEYKKAIIAMGLVQAINTKRSTEMSKGFWNTKLDKIGNPIKTWNPDERKIYVNAVIALESLMTPEIGNSEGYKAKRKKIQEKLDALHEDFSYEMYKVQSGGWVLTGRKYIPQIGEEVLLPTPQNPKVLMVVKGGWDTKVNAYYDELVIVYDEVYSALMELIAEIKDFTRKMNFGTKVKK